MATIDDIWEEDAVPSTRPQREPSPPPGLFGSQSDANRPAISDGLDDLFDMNDLEVPGPADNSAQDVHSEHGDASEELSSSKKTKENTGKKVIPKLDDEKLLSELGFPSLIKEAKAFKFDPKGNEIQDLGRILYMYQLWGHKMFPKFQFTETVDRVERLCHSRTMQVALSGYRDAEKELERRANQVDDEGGDDDEDNGSNGKADEDIGPPEQEQTHEENIPASQQNAAEAEASQHVSQFDEDEEMWDLVREFELEEVQNGPRHEEMSL